MRFTFHRVSRKLRPRKLRPQTQKTQTLGCLENSDPKNSDPRVSRKLRPKKLRPSGVSKTQTQKTQTLGCVENSDPKKRRPSGVSKTQTQKNSDPRVSRKLRPQKTSRKTHQEKWMYPSPTDPKTKLPSAKFTTKYNCVKRDCITSRFPYFHSSFINIRRSQPFATVASQPARSGAGLPRSLLFKVNTSDALKRLYIQKCTTSVTLFIIVLVKPVN